MEGFLDLTHPEDLEFSFDCAECNQALAHLADCEESRLVVLALISLFETVSTQAGKELALSMGVDVPFELSSLPDPEVAKEGMEAQMAFILSKVRVKP